MKLTSWGRQPVIDAVIAPYPSDDEVMGPRIPRGSGRSYGDCALSPTVMTSDRLKHFISFDETTGALTLDAGVLLKDILDTFMPRGWCLPVIPGTSLVTVGGAIAADVHGKNHHVHGAFSTCVRQFALVLPNGETAMVSPTSEPELFAASCGGMGLTGFITQATLQLRRIEGQVIEQTVMQAQNLAEALDYFEQCKEMTYSVAWIDCMQSGPNLGRAVVFAGEHADMPEVSADIVHTRSLGFPPLFSFISKHSMRLANALYFNKHADMGTVAVPWPKFFTPLDRFDDWNTLYGRAGLSQYQFVLPLESSLTGIKAILAEVARYPKGTVLCVLKRFGPENDNWLSFPTEGVTLALDFKNHASLPGLLDRLDQMVLDYEGRVYLAKDGRLSRAVFDQMYPQADKFRELRARLDPERQFASLQSMRLEI